LTSTAKSRLKTVTINPIDKGGAEDD